MSKRGVPWQPIPKACPTCQDIGIIQPGLFEERPTYKECPTCQGITYQYESNLWTAKRGNHTGSGRTRLAALADLSQTEEFYRKRSEANNVLR